MFSFSTRQKYRAGPPIPSVVNGASGTFSLHVVRTGIRSWHLMYARLIATVLAAFLAIAPQQPATKRQPAPVMSSQGAGWLIRAERIDEEQPDQMLKALDIKPGSVVADVGAGVGYHAWRLAEIVGPAGRVIAEDIQP